MKHKVKLYGQDISVEFEESEIFKTDENEENVLVDGMWIAYDHAINEWVQLGTEEQYYEEKGYRMDFTQFCETVRKEITDYLMQYEIEEISIRQVEKNNGVTMTGLVIAQQGSNISPNIYLENYHDAYSQGRSMESILREISDIYRVNDGDKM